MDALKDKNLEEIEIFQLVVDRTSVAHVVLQVSSIAFHSAAFHDQNGWIMDETNFELSTWIRMCYAVDQNNSTIFVNGAQGQDLKNNRGLNPQIGNVTLKLGKTLVGRITDVNLFSRSLSPEEMQGATVQEGEKCGAPGDLLSWENFNWKIFPCQLMNNGLK